jgi:PPK2 family polyphosphate:nucleotide phosphotransferase
VAPKHTIEELIRPFLVPPGRRISLADDFDPGYRADYLDRAEADELLAEGITQLQEYQDRLYAQDRDALLIVLQAMDAAGKDSVIKHVMSGLNPQGTEVHSFKAPSAEELDHDYLWRHVKALPERGRIGIFNRSHYEEVLVVRVQPEILANERLPAPERGERLWRQRFREINRFERFLVDNGTAIVKIFLNVSKEEQRKRFLERIERPEKNWKFSTSDCASRKDWDAYMAVYQDMLNRTSTSWAPWHVIPADHKWFTRLAVAAVVIRKLQQLDPRYPEVSEEHRQDLAQAKESLLAEG